MAVATTDEKAADAPPPRTKPHRRARRREALAAYGFLTPWMIGFVIFTIGPIIVSLFFSLTNYNIVNPDRTHMVGLENYRHALFEDPLFWKSMRVTIYYSLLALPANLVVGFLLALVLNKAVRGMIAFRTIYYLPAVMSGVVVTLLWVWIFNPKLGLFNWLLSLVGITGPAWLYDTSTVIPSLVIISLWGIGQTTLIYLAMLQAIPTELYEAAEIDGARPWSRLWRITLPMVTPAIFFNLVLGLIANFQYFTTAYVGTQGGPQNASLFYGLYLYENAFQYFKMGYASALAWLLFVVIAALTFVLFKTGGIWVFYQEDKGRV